VVEEADEEVAGDFLGAGVLVVVTAGEGEERVTEARVGGEDGANGGELAGAAAVLEGVEVAPGCASAGASTAAWPAGRIVHRWALMRHR
jgi:hypothetical protein